MAEGTYVVRLAPEAATALYAPGMREMYPNLCWRMIDNGDRCCIQERGHDGGIHESALLVQQVEDLAADRIARNAEIKRLRETLEEIAGIADDHPFSFTAQIVDLAHGALYDD